MRLVSIAGRGKNEEEKIKIKARANVSTIITWDPDFKSVKGIKALTVFEFAKKTQNRVKVCWL